MSGDDFRARLLGRARVAGVDLAPAALSALETYFELLVRWNAKMNLTGISLEPLADAGMDRLFVEPLVAAPFVPDTAIEWLDAGSGGGTPAIPMKIVRSRARLVMVESKARKAAFLREVARALGLSDVAVENGSFEELASRRSPVGTADLVTVRSVKLTPGLVDAAAALLRRSGQLFLFQSTAEPPPTLNVRYRFREAVPLPGPSSFLAIFDRLGDL